jgi:hypothetical protein
MSVEFKTYSEQWMTFKEEITDNLLALANELAGRFAEAAPAGATGELKGPFGVGQNITEGGIEVQVGTPLSAGIYAELDTRPHFMPWSPLPTSFIAWVEKVISPHTIAMGVKFMEHKGTLRTVRSKTGERHLHGAAARQNATLHVAMAIWHKIGQEGTHGKKYMQKVLQSLGLSFELVQSETESTYVVDSGAYLKSVMPGVFR